MTTVDRARQRSSWITAAIGAGALVAIVAVAAGLWAAAGDVEISTAGWLAMAFGVLLTVGLGVGLMSLVFISSRRGYDEQAGDDRGGGRH